MITEFTLDRARLASRFFVSGRACCLGQYAKACGHPGHTVGAAEEKLLRELIQPVLDARVYSTILVGNSRLLDESYAPLRHESEQDVIDAFAKAGITATFTGEYPT